ncbi:putative Ig domain-containing protein [Geothrix sp. 21YS21S-2]|uniref:putative Ig domain-containing protein n=1 Tax=Geothrix sp. 21YS21S-2 TaxID=3068893 RepID=UPI0027BABE83|nr:putative Ig domain-containing protein [Geothrix sp. 21YS21S-2]
MTVCLLVLSGCSGGGGGSPTPAVQAPSGLAYSANPATFTLGQAIANDVPSHTGGAPTAYSVTPALPAGLSLGAASGVISGTPGAITARATYTVTASNSAGSAAAAVAITVNDAAPSNLAYTMATAVYQRGLPIAANLASSAGGAVVSYAVSPALPAGLALDAATGAITGTPLATASPASYTVTATNTGGFAQAILVLSVLEQAPTGLAYSANPAVFFRGAAIAADLPSSAGGPVASYLVAPALPAGLSLDAGTGAITGTPTVLAAAAPYVVTATNTGGSAQATLILSVVEPAPTTLAYGLNPAVYTRGAAIAANTPSHGGGVVVSYAVSPALPAGLALNTSTGVITGTPTALAAPDAYAVTATNTSGSTLATLILSVVDVTPTSLAYSLNPAVYARGTAIPANTPSNAGGVPSAYAISPALPAGLAFSTATGAITGTPTALAAAVPYVVTATNTAGSAQATLTLSVVDQAPTGLAYSANPAVYTRGVAIPSNVPTHGGGGPTAYAVAPALPAGLALDTATGVIAGTPTAQTAAATYTVTASNALGGTQATLTLTVVEPAPTALAFSLNPAVYIRGTAITANTPSHGGGVVASYVVSPSLPAGLALNTSTGVITGTPTATAASAPYLVTASNTGGSAQATLTLTVVEPAPTALVYSLNPAVYQHGTAITANAPSNAGGVPDAYAVSPALPAGLVLSTSTGVITGTPTAAAASAPYVITASNTAGSTQATLTLRVVEAAPTGLTYTLAKAYYSVGVPATPNTPSTSGGDPATAYAVSPALPQGLAISATTGVISGTPTTSTAKANYTVTASNPGGAATASLSIVVYPPGPTLDLTVDAIELMQSPQTLDNSVPILAGKSGVARVFVVANQANTVAPAVQLTLTNDGIPVAGYPRTIPAPGASVPLAVAEGTLASSWNLAIPGSDLAAPAGTGYALTAVVDPQALVAEADRTNNTTTVALTGATVPTFRTTIFPVVLSSGTGNITEANKAAWVARLAKMWPVADVDVLVGATFTGSVATLGSDGTGWSALLSDLALKHQADAATNRYYYGALSIPYGSGVAGLGYIAGPGANYRYRTAIGWDKASGYADGGKYPEVFAHEIGHTFGLYHAPCGGVANPDAGYPYANGIIGTWAYDSVSNTLYAPTSWNDIMGYCSPNWVSDYNYKKVLANRNVTGGFLVASPEDPRECLLVRGLLHEDGTVELLPGFRTGAAPTIPPVESDLRVEGLDATGRLLFTAPLEAVEAGCGGAPRDRHFLAALPLASSDLDALADLRILKEGRILASRTSAGAPSAGPAVRRASGEDVTITWDARVHPGLLVRDASTGEVIAVLAGGERTIRTQAAALDLVFSDGIKGHTTHLKQVD